MIKNFITNKKRNGTRFQPCYSIANNNGNKYKKEENITKNCHNTMHKIVDIDYHVHHEK